VNLWENVNCGKPAKVTGQILESVTMTKKHVIFVESEKKAG